MKDHPRPMKHRTRKILLRFILLPVISLILLVGIAITILYSQQQHLLELAVRELNKQLPEKLAIAGNCLFNSFTASSTRRCCWEYKMVIAIPSYIPSNSAW